MTFRISLFLLTLDRAIELYYQDNPFLKNYYVLAMPSRKETAAQKGKSVARDTSQTRRVTMAHAQSMPGIVFQSAISTRPPPPEEVRAATTPIQGETPRPALEAQAPEPPVPQPGAEYRALRDAVHFLTRLVPRQAHKYRLGFDQVDKSDSLRARDLLSCNPPEFFGSKPEDDPHEFIWQMQHTLRIIKASVAVKEIIKTSYGQSSLLSWLITNCGMQLLIGLSLGSYLGARVLLRLYGISLQRPFLATYCLQR